MKKKIKALLIWFSSVLHRDTSPKVVFYHDIGQQYTPMGTPVNLFEAHMAWLRAVEVRGRGRKRNVYRHEVAFDDGFRGIWDARSRLKVEVDSGLEVVVFIAIALVGKPGYLTWDEIRTLQNDYGVNFQCHTWSHQTLIGPSNPDLPIPSGPNFRTDAWYHHELVDSKAELERQLNKTIDSLCFPVGYFSESIIRRCSDAGYTKLYASFPGNKDDANSNLPSVASAKECLSITIIPRCLCQRSSLFEFKSILNGGMNAMRKRYLAQHYWEK